MNRVTFGLWGTTLPITVVGLGGIIYVSPSVYLVVCVLLTSAQSGLQSFYGGEAFTLILGAIFPSFHHMPNTLPASAAITTQNLIGFLCFIAVYIPMICKLLDTSIVFDILTSSRVYSSISDQKRPISIVHHDRSLLHRYPRMVYPPEWRNWKFDQLAHSPHSFTKSLPHCAMHEQRRW